MTNKIKNRDCYVKCSDCSNIKLEGNSEKIANIATLKEKCVKKVSLEYTGYIDISGYRTDIPITFQFFKRYACSDYLYPIGGEYLFFPGINFSSIKIMMCDKDLSNGEVKYLIKIKNNSTEELDIVRVLDGYLLLIVESSKGIEEDL